MQFAVIQTGGKQYLVHPGQTLRIEKLDATEGGIIAFDRVLLAADGESVTLGAPYVSGATVTAKVIRNARDRKVIVFRYHPKTRYRKKKGHRQHFTEVRIEKISQ